MTCVSRDQDNVYWLTTEGGWNATVREDKRQNRRQFTIARCKQREEVVDQLKGIVALKRQSRIKPVSSAVSFLLAATMSATPITRLAGQAGRANRGGAVA